MDIAVGPVRLNGLRHFGDEVSPIAVPPVQQGGDLLDFQIVLIALVLLQAGNELLHLAQGLLVVDGEEHPRLDIDQLGGHGDKLAGYLQVHLLAGGHPGQILVQDQRDLNVLDLHLVFAQQVKDQVQGADKVLHVLCFGLDHPFQVVDRTVQSVPPNASQKK